MLTINNKFDLGQEVYLLELKPVKYDCPVCNGKGVFNHNGYDVKCPKCNGTGKIEDKNNRLYSVMDKTHKITGIRSNTSLKVSYKTFNDGKNGYEKSDIATTFRYNTTGGKRAEDRVFATLDDAIVACQKLNKKVEG